MVIAAAASAASTSPRTSSITGSRRPCPISTGVSRSQSTTTAARPASAASTDSARTMATGWPSYRIRSSENGITRTADGGGSSGKRGRSAAVSTAVTPGRTSAAAASTPRSRPAATGAPTRIACSTPSGRWSAA